MQTSVIGFPRIGTLRELKFASEKYFKKEITTEELLQTGKTLRKTHWNTQKKAGIDYISCNDFPIMICCWTQRYCLVSFQDAIKS